MCFELALPSSRGPKPDQKQEAVITQNLGAVYNSLGDYQRALQFHQKAAAIQGMIETLTENRLLPALISQSQCVWYKNYGCTFQPNSLQAGSSVQLMELHTIIYCVR